MKLFHATVLLGLLSACAVSDGSTQHPRYPLSESVKSAQRSLTARPVQSVPVQNVPTQTASVQTPPATAKARSQPNSAIPYYEVQSRNFKKHGRALSQRDAAHQAISARKSFWESGPSEPLQVGEYRVNLRHVRVDTHDFIFAAYASLRIGGNKFGLKRKVVEAVKAKTSCTLLGGYYAGAGVSGPGVVIPVSC